MKFLIIGCGSIGQRHFRNFRQAGVEEFVLCDKDGERLRALGSETGVRGTFTDHKKALSEVQGITAAVIASPSSLHVPMALDCAGAGVNLFLEKPLSHTLEGTQELIGLVKGKGLVAMMAMCYRFHPVFLRLKGMLDEGLIGRVYHANYYGGHYLPDWHPDADYRKEYAARRDLGGGLLLTSIHGYDNVRWLFGEVSECAAFVDKVSGLDMDVEDVALCIIRTESGIYVSSSADFLQRASQHRMVVAGESGTIRCDFITGRVERFTVAEGRWAEETTAFGANDMYLSEARHFLRCLGERAAPAIDLADGLKTLRLALAVKESSLNRKYVKV